MATSASKKKKLDQGQRRLSFTGGDLLLAGLGLEETQTHESDLPRSRRGGVDYWIVFAEHHWRTKYAWIEVKEDRVYCRYCLHSHASTRNKSCKFVTKLLLAFGLINWQNMMHLIPISLLLPCIASTRKDNLNH